MVKEFKDCNALAQYYLQVLGVEEDVTYHLSKWDPNNREKYIGDAEVWDPIWKGDRLRPPLHQEPAGSTVQVRYSL